MIGLFLYTNLLVFKIYVVDHLILQVAKSLMDIFAQMIFVHGFVHGDPHPGNILVSREGRTGFSIGTAVIFVSILD